jgi:hypothetical protein
MLRLVPGKRDKKFTHRVLENNFILAGLSRILMSYLVLNQLAVACNP